MLDKKIIEEIRANIGKTEYEDFYWNLYKLALSGLNIGNGGNVINSGEVNVLYEINKEIKKNELIVFDVGANIGNYSKAVLKYCNEFNNVNIHCFEPSKSTFELLKDNLEGKDNIILNNVGLNSMDRETKLYSFAGNSQLSSIYKRELDYCNIPNDGEEKVKLITLDSYCRSNGINYIDFLKIDVEGNEIEVLKGAKEMLEKKNINYIQFEFGGCNIDSRTYFKDFWDLLSKNYNFYRIMKDGFVKLNNYNILLECFNCSNFLCKLK